MFKEYQDLSDDDWYKFSKLIRNLYNLDGYEDIDYLYTKNKIRRIMEILLTKETYNKIIQEYKEIKDEKIQDMVSEDLFSKRI